MALRLKTWLKRLAIAMVVLAFVGWVTAAWLVKRWTSKPPSLPADTSIRQLKPETRDGKVWLGKSWKGKRDGLLVVYLKGSPFEMGYADGVLMEPEMHTLENEFLKMIQGYVPQHWIMETLKYYIIYRDRHLSEYVPIDYRMEIYGTSLGCSDSHPEEGSFYNRLLNYHAAHDISYMMIDNPFISRAGCTAFGAWGESTAAGHLISGRNFDWEAAEVFSRDRVVMMCEPDGGIPYISLAWAGMAGVVSGMNRAGVSVTINGAPSSLPKDTATPVAMVARDVMQKARNLSEALDIVRNAHVFVSTLWLLGSKADGKFVVVEKTPERMQVREAEGDSIICANHFQTPGLGESPRNQEYIAQATSASRAERLKELIKDGHGNIDSPRAVEFLRDRKLPGGVAAGNGHRGTLNAFIATHATVMDLTEGIFWAASPPNQMGKFVAFDVSDFAKELPEQTVEQDVVLTSGEFEKAHEAQKCLAEGQQELKHKQAQQALNLADKAETLNPGYYRNATLRGRALAAMGKQTEAVEAYSRALKESPAFLKEKRELEALSKESKPEASR